MGFLTFDLEIKRHVNFEKDIYKMIDDILYYIKRKGYCQIRIKYHDELDRVIEQLTEYIKEDSKILKITELRSNILRIELEEANHA